MEFKIGQQNLKNMKEQEKLTHKQAMTEVQRHELVGRQAVKERLEGELTELQLPGARNEAKIDNSALGYRTRQAGRVTGAVGNVFSGSASTSTTRKK